MKPEYLMVAHLFDPVNCAECAYIVEGLIATNWRWEEE